MKIFQVKDHADDFSNQPDQPDTDPDLVSRPLDHHDKVDSLVNLV